MSGDKNHAAILMWSLGNESGIGCNQNKMAEYLHSRNRHNLVHCEDISRRNADRLHGDDEGKVRRGDRRCPAESAY